MIAGTEPFSACSAALAAQRGFLMRALKGLDSTEPLHNAKRLAHSGEIVYLTTHFVSDMTGRNMGNSCVTTASSSGLRVAGEKSYKDGTMACPSCVMAELP